jgi:hydroxymethylglutaryl-CoA synthase
MASFWVSSGLNEGKKALVICSDLSQLHVNDSAEIVTGGSAVAFVVSNNPQILEIDLDKAGYWTNEIADTFRPTSKYEVGNGELSVYSYLDALEGAYNHYAKKVSVDDYDGYFKKHIYHAPFPGMTFQAHLALLNQLNIFNRETITGSFQKTVLESLTFAKKIGSSYGGSNFICLLGLLASASDLKHGDRISMFSYGSGCQGEFYEAKIGPSACDYVRSLQIDRQLEERRKLSVKEYELNEFARQKGIDCIDYQPSRDWFDNAYDELYKGKEFLVLKEVKDFVRRYEWS